MVRRVIAISGSPLADWAVFNDKFRAMNTRQAEHWDEGKLNLIFVYFMKSFK